jgi:Xaa-Pro aminopeptidase
MNPYEEKLNSLRAALKGKGIDVYLIPSSDPHLGEYVPEHWRIIEWLTGFTGSAASLAITDTFAGLWTDSRYFIQAENQLPGSGFTLMNPVSPDLNSWLSEYIDHGSKLALDGRLFSIDKTRKLMNTLEEKIITYDFTCDLISELWTERPPMPHSMAFDHSVKFCGLERNEKIALVKAEMKIRKIDYQLLTALDDIMWLFNIRGDDIKYSPLLISFTLVGEEQILLFTDESKIPLKLASEFDRLDIVMLPYEETAGMISTLSEDSKILVNPFTTSFELYTAIPSGVNIIEDLSIPTRLKAIKNKIEKENIRKVMIKDGVALTKFFFWLGNVGREELLTEVALGEKIDNLRSENENYLGPSFSTIVAFNEHGALPHYSATFETDVKVGKNGILLIDSGGQYLDGTTDITRTISIGKPTVKQKTDFTLVLKGTINLALAKFPSGTKGSQLDILARKALWGNGLNYGHGTGHGVGFCLNVHEGPQNISPLTGSYTKTSIEPGMLISDEPAIYREGEYGIRIENLILCIEDNETSFGKFLKFETVSLCYIDKNLIDISLLDKKEINWLNSYHSEVYEKIGPFLPAEEKQWLKSKTSSI